MSRKSTSNVKKVLINLFRYLHILISFGHKLRKESTLFFVNLVKLTSKFRDGVRCNDEDYEGYVGCDTFNITDEFDDEYKKTELFRCEE